jgi:hypothetical protein
MWKTAEDAKALAETHQEMCGRDDCTRVCEESSPLFWAKSLKSQSMPGEARHDKVEPKSTKVAGYMRSASNAMERTVQVVQEQAAVLEHAAQLIEEHRLGEGTPEEVIEMLSVILSRPIHGKGGTG